MPQIGLKGIQFAAYTNTQGAVTYGTPTSAGDAMTANLELRFAEGRLYAEDALSEYIRLAIGGTLSLGVKYIPDAAQKLIFGLTEKTRSVTVSGTSTNLKSLQTNKSSRGAEVGVSFYADDVVDGVHKYTCVFIPRARFGEPARSLQTLGETINFATPTTTGEFLADHTSAGVIKEVITVDSEAAAIAWCAAVFPTT